MGSAVALSGCASGHTVEPFRSDDLAAERLQRYARETCSDMETAVGIPERAFVTDGCTAWIDGVWAKCCVAHDARYWCGGTREQRRQADRALDACVADHASGFWGTLMWMGVRVGGHPVVPADWRWGYGRDYPAGYDPPPAEREASPSPDANP